MSDNGQVPETIQPQPTSVTYQVGKATLADGSEMVVIQFLMVTGTTMLFFNREDANKLAAMIKKNADGVAGIVVAQQVPDMKGIDTIMKKIKGEET